MNLFNRRLLAAVVIVALPTPGIAAITPAAKAAGWLAAQQQPDGGFFTPDMPADGVADAVTALVAGGGKRDVIERALASVKVNGPARSSQRAAYAGRIAMAIAAAGDDPHSFGGVDYVARIEGFKNAAGQYDTGSGQFSNSLAALGILASGAKLPADALRAIRLAHCADGGFSYEIGCSSSKGSDVDTTAITICALVADGVAKTDGILADSRLFLLAAANDEGGYGFYPGDPTNANSTGLALAAIASMKENPQASPWAVPGGDPRRSLFALQAPSGGFRYSASRTRPDNTATVQAIPGAAGIAFPVPPVTAGRTSVKGRLVASPSPTGVTRSSGAKPARASFSPLAAPPTTAAQILALTGDRSPDATRRASRTLPLAAASVLLFLVTAPHVLHLTLGRRR